MLTTIAPKLKRGDAIRIIAPSRSMSIIRKEVQEVAVKRLEDLGLVVSFGQHVNESDDFASSSIQSRLDDLHAAFADASIKAVLTVIGGFNSNQLLRQIDWELIRANPKIFSGYSDITALSNAIYAKTGLVTYSGPHFSSFGQEQGFEYTLEHFQQTLFEDRPLTLRASRQWHDRQWWKEQGEGTFEDNPGYLMVQQDEAEGSIVGGNLCTLNLLHGTEYMPSLDGTILFLEDDSESLPHTFDRDLQSLIHQPGFDGVRGLVIGRFQKASQMTPELLKQIVASKEELRDLPVIADVDFGHTDPKITFLIGGTIKIHAGADGATIEILTH